MPPKTRSKKTQAKKKVPVKKQTAAQKRQQEEEQKQQAEQEQEEQQTEEQEQEPAGAAGAAAARGTLDWNKSWAHINKNAIKKLASILDGGLEDRKMTTLFQAKEYVAVYTLAYSLCTQRHPHNCSERLYQKHSEVIAAYLDKTVLPALRAAAGGDALLAELSKRWGNHQVMNQWMQRFFMYLDRYYVKHNALPPLLDSGVQLFQTTVHSEIKGEVSSALLALIAREREGEAVDQSLIAGAVDVLDNMGANAYQEDLQAPLLEATRAHYAAKAQAWLTTDDTPVYLLKAERALEAEAARVRAYLHGATEGALLPVVVEKLLGKHVHALVDREGSGCAALLAQDKLEDLARMYRLFKRVDHPTGGAIDENGEDEDDANEPTSAHRGLAPVAAAFKGHVTVLGQQVIDATSVKGKSGGGGGREKEEEAKPNDGGGEEKKGGKGEGSGGDKAGGGSSSASALEAAGVAYIKGLLAIHDTYAGIVARRLDNSPVFAKALKEAFVLLVNKSVLDNQRTSAELMAAFCNRLMAKGGEKLTDEELEGYLEKVLILFSYLHDKDVFLDAYSATLAKRLLSEKSSSVDAEKLMVSKLKGRMGPSFVSRLEGMMADLAISRDTMTAWSQQESVKDSAPLRGFSARVLTQGIWPSSMGRGEGMDAADVLLPPQMAQALDAFKRWYDHRTPGRRLKTNLLLGQVEVRITIFPSGASSSSATGKTYDAQAAPLQAVILLAFQGLKPGETLSLAALAERTRMNVADIKPLLHSLACAKYKLLAKTPPGGKAIGDGDLFSANAAFSCPKRVFALQLPDVKRAHNPARLEEDRGYIIDAAIVRVAKARRLISHNDLLAEVAQQINHFKAQPVVIKKRIAGLIEKEFLERDASDRSLYRYMP